MSRLRIKNKLTAFFLIFLSVSFFSIFSLEKAIAQTPPNITSSATFQVGENVVITGNCNGYNGWRVGHYLDRTPPALQFISAGNISAANFTAIVAGSDQPFVDCMGTFTINLGVLAEGYHSMAFFETSGGVGTGFFSIYAYGYAYFQVVSGLSTASAAPTCGPASIIPAPVTGIVDFWRVACAPVNSQYGYMQYGDPHPNPPTDTGTAFTWSCYKSSICSSCVGVSNSFCSQYTSYCSTNTSVQCSTPKASATVSVNVSCTSPPNSCGAVNTGTTVNGSCDAITPANPTGYGTSCTSSANSCGQTNTGTIQCDGSCNATAPPNSSCPVVPTPPALPTGLTQSCPTPGTSATLSWTSVTGATHYQLRANNQTANGWNDQCDGSQNSGDICLNVNSPTHTFTSQAGANYAWWVHSCNASGCTPTATDGTNFTCTAPVVQIPAPALTFSATPTTIESGQTSTLTWASTNATSCTAGGAWSGTKAASNSENTGALTANRTYTLTCTGAGGTTQAQSVTVNVNAPVPVVPDVSISADNTSVLSGSGTTIRWSATNANSGNSCTASGGSGTWAGARPSSGTFSTGNLISNQTYSIRCSGDNGGLSPLISAVVNVTTPQSCTSAANACSQTNTGTIVNGSCNATTPANPTGFGTSCTSSANSCGQINIGTIQCDGSCNATAPPNSSCPVVVVACTSAANACSQTNSGTVVNGSCNATTPANPSGFGTSCTSSANSCGQTNTGTRGCDGSCSANTPPNSQCPAPVVTACISPENSCGATNNGTVVGGVCNATAPANPTGFGNSCQSAANSCGQRATGTISCNGLCSAVTPSNSSCPITETTAVACSSSANSCGLVGSGVIVNGSCNAVVPPNPTGFGRVCDSAANTCGQTNSGTFQCNGSCNAIAPPNSNCTNTTAVSDAVNTVSAPTLTFSASDTSTSGGTSVELRWSTTNATSCTASGDWGDSRGSSGTFSTGNLTSSKRYSLVCVGQGGSISRSVNVNVSSTGATNTNTNSSSLTPAAPSGGANLSPTMLFVADRGASSGQVRLSWSSTNATSCVGSGGWDGSRGTSGNVTLRVSSNTRYTLTCSGGGGEASRTLQVEVDAPISTTPTTPTRPSTPTRPTTPTTPTFIPRAPVVVPITSSVVRENSSGDIVAVSSGRESLVSPPVISLIASPIVAFNNPANIEWSVANASKCSASGNWQGEKDVNGKEITTPLQEDVVYTLRCEGDGGEASRTIEIVVTREEPVVTKIIGNLFEGIADRIFSIFSSNKKEEEIIETTSNNEENTEIREEGVSTPNIPTPVISKSISGNNQPSVILYVTPIVKKGTAANIEWRSTNTNSCVASGAWSGGKPTEGVELTADLFEDSTYTINCFGSNGTTTATVNTVVFEEEDSFLGRIQRNVSNGFNRILEVFKGSGAN